MISTLSTARGDVVLRPIGEADAEAYREVRLEGLRLHPEAFGADYEATAARPIEEWLERARKGAAGDEGVTYVAEAAGQLLGMVALVRNATVKTRHAATIYGVYVRPAWRGLGIADALLGACVEHGRTIGLRLVRLGVATCNIAAVRVYARCGFSVYGVEPESIRVGDTYHDELLMARRLVP
jgi:RimJ/RimL family protein N-acetyltransferase